MRLFLTLLLFVSALAQAEPWDTTDKVFGGAALVTTMIDWGQTRYIAKHPDRFWEVGSSRFIGEHPSVGKVNNYFAASTLFYGTAANLLPSVYRKVLLGGVVVMRVDVISKNYSLGIKINF